MGDKYIIKEGILRYPSFHYKELENLLNSKDLTTTEYLLKTLNILKGTSEKILHDIKSLIDSNLFNFNQQVNSYNKITLDYLVLSEFIIKLCEIIIHKISNKKEPYILNKEAYLSDLKKKYPPNDEHINQISERVKIV